MCRACRGSGRKPARELLEKFGTLDNLLEHVDEVAGKKRQENLREHRRAGPVEPAACPARLATRRWRIDWPRGRAGQYDPARVGRAVRGVRLSQPDVENARPGGRGSARAAAAIQTALSKRSTRPSGCDWLVERNVAAAVDLARHAKRPASRRAGPRLVGYSFSWPDGAGYYLPVRGPAGSQLLDLQRRSRRCGRCWKIRRSARSARI